MRFNYREIPTHSVEGMRFYETPEGNFYPSMTTVLGQTMSDEKIASLEGWRNSIGHQEADKITNDAAARGTAVHLLAERFLKGEPLMVEGEEWDPEHVKSFNCLKFKLKKVNEVWAQEVPLWSDRLGVAGRTDLVGVFSNFESIVDYKTSRRMKTEEDIADYKVQLAGYAEMHNEMFGTNITKGVILMASGAGFAQEFHVDLTKHFEEFQDRVQQFYNKQI
jgi:CRISPR/Cas system-associated exonuclease Cas4 (RecB family)